MTDRVSTHDREEAAERRLLAGFFRFAAGYLLKGPDDETEKVLADPEWIAAVVDSGLVPERIAALPAAERADQNHQFMTRFRIPGDRFIPPFEQAYRDGKATVDDAAVSECLQVYAVAGYQLEPFTHIQADHVGHQARFLAAVLEREADCLEQDDGDGPATVRTWRTGFIDEHCSWWAELASRVSDDTLCRQIQTVVHLLSGLAKRVGDRGGTG